MFSMTTSSAPRTWMPLARLNCPSRITRFRSKPAQRQVGLGDHDFLPIDTRRDEDQVTRPGRIHRRLDGGVILGYAPRGVRS